MAPVCDGKLNPWRDILAADVSDQASLKVEFVPTYGMIVLLFEVFEVLNRSFSSRLPWLPEKLGSLVRLVCPVAGKLVRGHLFGVIQVGIVEA